MEIRCYHCQTQLPLASLSFCRDCCVSVCSAGCFENHSAAGENGRQLHDMSQWNESNQKEAISLILAHLSCHMEEVKIEGEAELVQLGERIDRLKELIQKQIRFQLENRLSHLQRSVKTIRDAFKVTTNIDCADLSTSRRAFAAEARFLLEKLVDCGLRIDLHPDANPVMLGIRRVSDIAEEFCSSNDPFSSTVENSSFTFEDENMHAEPLSTSDETSASDDVSERDIDAQRGSSASALVKEELNENSLEGASDNEADFDVCLICKAEDRAASSLRSNSLLPIEFDSEYQRLVEENKQKREVVFQVKEESRQKEFARLQGELSSKTREDEASNSRHSSKQKKSRSRRFSATDKVRHSSHGTGSGHGHSHNRRSVTHRSKQHPTSCDEARRYSSGKDDLKHPQAAAERGHKSGSASGRSKRHSTSSVEYRSRVSDIENPDNKYRSAKNTAGISCTSTPASYERFVYDDISEPELDRLDNDDFMDDSFVTVSRCSCGSTGFQLSHSPASRMRTASPHVTPTSTSPRCRSPIMSYTPTSSRHSPSPAYKRAFSSPNSSVADVTVSDLIEEAQGGITTSHGPSANFVVQQGRLPNDWKSAWDTDGRPYYYHVKSLRRRYEMPDEDDSGIEEAFLAALASKPVSEQRTNGLVSA